MLQKRAAVEFESPKFLTGPNLRGNTDC
jgi:adenylosuccinate synthase